MSHIIRVTLVERDASYARKKTGTRPGLLNVNAIGFVEPTEYGTAIHLIGEREHEGFFIVEETVEQIWEAV